MQAGFAFGAVPRNSAVGALTGHALGLGGVRDGPTLHTDAFDEQLPAAEVQPGITVSHEDLRTVGDLDSAHRTRRSSLRQQPTRSVNNLLAEYT